MNQERDEQLREEIRAGWPQHGQPSFGHTLQAAQDRYSASQRNVRRFAGVAAVAAVVAVAVFGNAPTQDTYIEVADLMDTTYWTAPSDVLLPERQFDIYQDMPDLFESTEPAGGTLL